MAGVTATANAAPDPETRQQRLKRLFEENVADELVAEPALKRIKARETEMLTLLQAKSSGKPGAVGADKSQDAVKPDAETQPKGNENFQ